MLTRRIPELRPELARNGLTDGCVFGWLPEFAQRDFVGGRAGIVGADLRTSGIAVGGGITQALVNTDNSNNVPADYVEFSSPVSSGNVSWLALCEGLSHDNAFGTLVGLTAATVAEHMPFSDGLLYLGPFSASRWVNGVARPTRLDRAFLYGGTIASGVTNGAVAYVSDFSIATATVTTAFPTSIRIFGQSPTSSNQVAGIGKVGFLLIWNRALSRQDMSIALRDPARLFNTSAPRRFVDLGSPPPAPEIAVTGNAVNIADGDATPSTADHTDFGTITQGGATVSRTFTVSNPGTATLTISSVTVPTGYTVATALPGTIAASGSAPLIVRLDNASAGTKSGDITIAHDAVGSPFNFAVTGVVNAAASGGVRTSRTDAIRGTVFGVVRSVIVALAMFMNI